LKTFVTQNPDHKAWGAMAAQKLAACDLNWATTLYRELGDSGDTDAAIAMGRIYDPVEHLCPAIQDQQHPMSADTAAFWYQKAVQVNSAEASRRLGILWTKPGKDGPHYADGVDFLKKAAASGDAPAADALKGLGQ
jgi:TPR repeat protein